MTYIWQQPGWANFAYDITDLVDELTVFERHAGHVRGMLDAQPEGTQVETLIDLRFRGDYTPGCRRLLQRTVAANDRAAFVAAIGRRDNWPSRWNKPA